MNFVFAMQLRFSIPFAQAHRCWNGGRYYTLKCGSICFGWGTARLPHKQAAGSEGANAALGRHALFPRSSKIQTPKIEIRVAASKPTKHARRSNRIILASVVQCTW